MKYSAKNAINVIACIGMVVVASSCGNKKSGGDGKFAPAQARSQGSSTDSDASSNSESVLSASSAYSSAVRHSSLTDDEKMQVSQYLVAARTQEMAGMRLSESATEGSTQPATAGEAAVSLGKALVAKFAANSEERSFKFGKILVEALAEFGKVEEGLEAASTLLDNKKAVMLLYGAPDHANSIAGKHAGRFEAAMSSPEVAVAVCDLLKKSNEQAAQLALNESESSGKVVTNRNGNNHAESNGSHGTDTQSVSPSSQDGVGNGSAGGSTEKRVAAVAKLNSGIKALCAKCLQALEQSKANGSPMVLPKLYLADSDKAK